FRFVNPYGFPNYDLAIDKVSISDPLTKQELVLDVGSADDADGSVRIAGTDWGPREIISGRSVRRLKPAELESIPETSGAPRSYFYLSLPSEWHDNLRTRSFELSFVYLDEAAAHVSIEQRSISPGEEFRAVRDGDLFLTGAGNWRTWKVPLRTNDLGYWVGQTYAAKHFEYLDRLSAIDTRLEYWAKLAR